MNSKLNVLVVGTGMYTCGRGTPGYGTVIPALMEWKKGGRLGEVYVAGTSPEGAGEARRKIGGLEKITGVGMPVRYFPQDGQVSPECYKEAMAEIPRPAACIVCVPDHLHSKIAGDAIIKGLHTLVVKPLTPTLKEVNKLLDLQKRHNVYCAVEFHKRYDCANLMLKDRISDGSIGDPLSFIAEFSQRKCIPSKVFSKWVSGTNIFQYLGIHYVDIIYFVT
ncbi:MAG: Gfo/Idh/MocA family oxidoreductase, partial [Candidatus Omnitrophota bacterium]